MGALRRSMIEDYNKSAMSVGCVDVTAEEERPNGGVSPTRQQKNLTTRWRGTFHGLGGETAIQTRAMRSLEPTEDLPHRDTDMAA
jgi:hypothetical protein